MQSTMNLYLWLGIAGDTLKQMETMFTQSLAMMRYMLPMALAAGSGFGLI